MKILSRRAYQFVALAMLVLVYGVAFDLCYRGVIPIGGLDGGPTAVLGALCVLVGATAVWIALVLPLRLISDAPAIQPPAGTSFADAYAEARADLQRQDTPERRRRYHVRMAAAGTAVGVASAAGVLANFVAAPDHVFVTPIAFVVACVGLVPYHALRALFSR